MFTLTNSSGEALITAVGIRSPIKTVRNIAPKRARIASLWEGAFSSLCLPLNSDFKAVAIRGKNEQSRIKSARFFLLLVLSLPK